MLARPVRIVLTGFLLLFFVAKGFGATRIYLPHDRNLNLQGRGAQTLAIPNLRTILELTPQEELKFLNQRTDRNNVTRSRYHQTFDGIPVWGHHIIAAKDQFGNILSLHGTKVAGLADDFAFTALFSSEVTTDIFMHQMKARHIANSGKSDQNWLFKNEGSQRAIYLDQLGRAQLVHVISFFADIEQGGSPSRPTIIIDTRTGEIIKEFDALAYAEGVGPGGNEKIGAYYYGQDFPAFEVTESDSQCIMNNDKVKTWDMQHSTSSPIVHTYTCYENTYKEINGAFCPLNDAHFIGGIVYDMYIDWFNAPVLPFQITIGVHYSDNFENAFWNGAEAIFGDGATRFYPMVGLNIISHEIAHGFTEQHSNLIYSDQSGAINESFSDMAGEAAEYYFTGSNDFMVGHDIWKGTGALRYMDDPPMDGRSIDSANDYYAGMDVHYSSGIFNKAFYNLATTPGWNTRQAFEVFVKANQDYWEPSTDFARGAQGVYDAAIDLGYQAEDVTAAFNAVDVEPGTPPVLRATFGYAVDLLSVSFTDYSTCQDCTIVSWQWDFGDGETSTAQNPTHTYTTSGWYTVRLTITDDYGQEDVASRLLRLTEEEVAPTAAFTSAIEGLTVTFTDRSSVLNASIVDWHWDFGDGIQSGLQHPTHTYESGGTYFVTLTVTDSRDQTDATSNTLKVTPYCESEGQSYYNQWIAKVAIGDFSHSSTSSGYTDFTTEVIDVQQGLPYTVTLSPGPPWSPHLRYWRIWADLNLDDDFEDTGEILFEGAGITAVNGTITIPMSSIEGYTQLRVSMSLSDYPSPCGSFQTGEVEDYTLNIVTGAPQPSEPVAAFGFATNGLTVTFADQSTVSNANIVGWQWDFGDSHQSIQQNPSHTYASEGTYTVALTVTDSNGQTDTTSQMIFVSDSQPQPSAAFSFATVDLTVSFIDQSTSPSGTIVSWLWDFGDGSQSSLQHPSHTYASGGTYTVALTVTGSNGQTATTSQIVLVSGSLPYPNAAFSFTATDLAVSFIDQSTSPSGTIVEWQWDFGDEIQSDQQHPSHTYASGGIYTVTLAVTDNNGQTDIASQSLTVSEAPLLYCASEGLNSSFQWIANMTIGDFSNPSASSGYTDFTAHVIDVQKGSPYTVTLSHGPPRTVYPKHWRIWVDLNRDGDFTDEGELLLEDRGYIAVTGTITLPMFTVDGETQLRVSMGVSAYPEPCGNFYFGEVEDYTLNILSGLPQPSEPAAAFDFETSGLTVSFTDQSIVSNTAIVGWQWDFGDGHQSSQQHPLHTYAYSSTYTVTLTVTDANGQTDTTSQMILVSDTQPQPNATFGFTAAGLTVAFVDESTSPAGTIVSWQWDFGDGHQSSLQHPSHTYASNGTYSVTLSVTDNDGQTDFASQPVTVADGPIEYCGSGSQIYYFHWIAKVTLGNFSKSSTSSSYSDFTAHLVDVQKGSSYSVTLSPGPPWSPTPRFWRMWADLNRDGDFHDAGELMLEASEYGEVTGVITVPTSAVEGDTRLRVSMGQFDYPNPCGNVDFGEVEDYTLRLW